MKKFPLSCCLLLICLSVAGQKESITGKPVVELFSDFHYYVNDTSATNGFGLGRAFLGYKFIPEGDFSATVILNAVSPSELSQDAKPRRYAYFREASIAWTHDRFFLSFGMTTGRSIYFQQQFLGKRYIADNLAAINGYTYIADLGFVADYRISDKVTVDLTLMNGEGYSNLHVDNSIKSSAGITIIPLENTAIRLYADIDKPGGVLQSTLIGFLGYRNKLLFAGTEASYKSGVNRIEGHNSWALSTTAGINVHKNVEIFGRYDFTSSSTSEDDFPGWNCRKDGRFAVIAIEYTFNQYARIALDYQGIFPEDELQSRSDGIFLNAHFKF